MIHIYGHTWPVRWGKPGELRQVKVYSNCPEVELIANGASLGTKQRHSADFPAAGLRWDVAFRDGANTLRAIGRSNGVVVADEISVAYQTATWGKPARLELTETGRNADTVTIEARVYDAAGVSCLDAANLVRFGVTGDARLIDNLGTVGGSRAIQLANGRAWISLHLTGAAIASVSTDGLPTVFLPLASP
jgi:beta-galactosidase